MRAINLAEERIAERTYCRQYINRRLRIGAMLVALMVSVTVVSFACRMSVTNRASALKAELAKIQGRCVTIRQGLAETKARVSQRSWQQQLAQGSKRWLGVLDTVLSRVPANVWLNRVESSDTSSTVVIEGQAGSFEALSAFIGSLRSSPRFTEVRLNGSQVSSVKGDVVVDFSLQLKLKAAEGVSATAPSPTQAPAQPQGLPQTQETP